ncbi:MAG: photoactive yellow protein [Leptospiraceae bacterium]|nr:photoactive yellow protein [Leptospiraceae bacterium]
MEDFAKGILYNLGYLSRDQADGADFGIIKVDDNGLILLYNRYESELAGVPVQKAENKNFFTQIAICTNNRLFFGRFKDGIAKGYLDISFNYVFTYKMKPTNVIIQLYRDQPSSTNWIFVKKK